jgi:PIN domain nuclease of toxin-antitoxin system
MSAYFFDSSAFVKRFAKERGSAFVIGLLRPSSMHSIYVARVTEVEVCAALPATAQATNSKPNAGQQVATALPA